jgi:hypothetical protein
MLEDKNLSENSEINLNSSIDSNIFNLSEKDSFYEGGNNL